MRDAEAEFGTWYESFNERRMVLVVLDDDENEIEIPASFEVCALCDGRGSHVNPSIDAHGLTADDFADDPDFAEDYRRGTYDEPCYRCGGTRVEHVVSERASAEQKAIAEQAKSAHREMRRERDYEMRMGY